jgi:hypothetical protein
VALEAVRKDLAAHQWIVAAQNAAIKGTYRAVVLASSKLPISLRRLGVDRPPDVQYDLSDIELITGTEMARRTVEYIVAVTSELIEYRELADETQDPIDLLVSAVGLAESSISTINMWSNTYAQYGSQEPHEFLLGQLRRPNQSGDNKPNGEKASSERGNSAHPEEPRDTNPAQGSKGGKPAPPNARGGK